VESSPAWLQVARDVAIIILAVETIVIGILVGALVFVILKLVRMVRGHIDRLSTSAEGILTNVKETTQTAAQTARTAQSTATYVSDRTVRPLIEVYSAVAGARRFVEAFFSRNRERKSGETNGRD
jgi:hypothetical protein